MRVVRARPALLAARCGAPVGSSLHAVVRDEPRATGEYQASIDGTDSRQDEQAGRASASASASMSPSAGISSSQPPLNFQHPYLDSRVKRPQKRELGLFDLFVFKVFGCFTPDDLPPPNPDATIYQAGAKSSSSSVTLASTGTATTGRTSAAPVPPASPAAVAAASAGGGAGAGAAVVSGVTGTAGGPLVGVSPGTSGGGGGSASAGASASALSVTLAPAPNAGGKLGLTVGSHKRRASRAEARARQSAWPVKVPEAPRVVMERTQFVEQRVEQKKREAKRRLEEERARAAAEAAESSAAILQGATLEKLTQNPLPVQKKVLKSVVESRDQVVTHFPFDRTGLDDRRLVTSQISSRESTPKADEAIQSASVAGRVSRLSAMFEQQ